MGTQKLSEGIKSKIIGWELIGEKYDGEDFNHGDEVILNMFYDRSNARLNIIFSLNYGDLDCNEYPSQDVLLMQCFGIEDYSCHFVPGNDYVNAIYYKDYGDAVELIVDSAGMSFIAKKIVVEKLPWCDAMKRLMSREEYYGK